MPEQLVGFEALHEPVAITASGTTGNKGTWHKYVGNGMKSTPVLLQK